ncbi:hypothetical protein EYF80_035228 [Liparis tanakae]|uniref:Uncharacterized protein n=1 Tax=Liparis tanakae TaxID=230148 RepID=A0A4Z2GMT7_9TELE|nr:hypothetical protein EYF80_035228 [Liparis tanakae]
MENTHCQVPASERLTDSSRPECGLPSGLVQLTAESRSRPLTWQWSVASLPSWRSAVGLAQTERERGGGMVRTTKREERPDGGLHPDHLEPQTFWSLKMTHLRNGEKSYSITGYRLDYGYKLRVAF